MKHTVHVAPRDTVEVIADGVSSPPIVTEPPVQPPYVPPVTPPEGSAEYSLDWNDPLGKVIVAGLGGGIAVGFTTGNISTTGSLPRIGAAEYNGPPLERFAVLSETPHDFDHPVGNAPYATMRGKSVTAIFALGTGSSPGYPTLELNKRYYFNIRNDTQEDGGFFCGPIQKGAL